MKIIVCVDNDMGMMFNHRRQSRDGELCKYIINEYGKEKIYMTEYSSKIFDDKESVVLLDEKTSEMNDGIKDDGYVFIENPVDINERLQINVENIDEIIMCLWNRKYHSDQKFDMDISRFNLVDTVDIVGSSHDKITIKTYRRI